MNFIFLIQARSSSTRLPKKILNEITPSKTLIELVYGRVKMVGEDSADKIWVLIPTSKTDDELALFLKEKNIPYFRGPEEDVYLRFYEFLEAQTTKPDYVFRICSDNPFIEPDFIKNIINKLEESELRPDYISFEDSTGTPAILTHFGFFVEAIKYNAFMEAKNYIKEDNERMHVTPVFYKSNKFKVEFLPMPIEFKNSSIRCTIDTIDDFNIIKGIFKLIKDKDSFSYKDIIDIINKNPQFISEMQKNIDKNKK